MRRPTFLRLPSSRLASTSRGRALVLGLMGALLGVAACDSAVPGQVLIPATTISPVARAYLDSALNLMERRSINRKRIDWPAFRARAASYAGNAQTSTATYPAIRQSVTELGDRHSGFFEPGTFRLGTDLAPVETSAGLAAPIVFPRGARIHPRVAWFTVPQYSNRDGDAVELVNSYQTLLRMLDAPEVCGWIVDARGNLGGNMHPMVAGAVGLAGNGVAGFFVDPDSNITAWYHHRGTAGVVQRGAPIPGTSIVAATVVPFVRRVEAQSVAVLQDSLTASSGEALVISFRGLPNARSFGGATWGVSTANQAFRLADGATLNLTSAYMADRTGVVYGDRVAPDQAVAGDPLVVRDSAVAWVLRQSACLTPLG